MRSSSIWFNHFFNSTSGWKRKNSFSLQPEVDFFDISEVTALCAFHTKNILFSINCHVAVCGSKFTNDPSKCSQQIGLLPYHLNLLVIFVIFEKNWRLRKKTDIGFDEICTPISKLSFVAISNSKILKPKELTSQVSILLRLILLVSENRKYFEIFVNTHRWWRIDHGDEYIFNGTSPIPVNFIKLSPPDHNMTTHLDRWDPHLSDSIIFLIQLQVGSEKIAFRYNRKFIFLTLARLGHWYALCAFHTKNILFSINCHVAVSGSKFTNDPSKCSQQIGLLPYYHNFLVIFVIFEKNWLLRKKTAKTVFWNVDLGTLAKF